VAFWDAPRTKQENVFGSDIERTETIIFDKCFESKHLFVEGICSLQIVRV
jgi:hypothetical protein